MEEKISNGDTCSSGNWLRHRIPSFRDFRDFPLTSYHVDLPGNERESLEWVTINKKTDGFLLFPTQNESRGFGFRYTLSKPCTINCEMGLLLFFSYGYRTEVEDETR